jgi:hypothetical protein
VLGLHHVLANGENVTLTPTVVSRISCDLPLTLRKHAFGWHASLRPRFLGSQTERQVVGAVIMLGTLFGLIALIWGLVWRFDPEARGPKPGERK